MEKFAIKIDENVRLRLYKICRLCGTDNRNNSEILEGERIISDGEPDFHKKILDCIGIQVTKLDKMPQTICDLCRDKINDFFEFREMCVTTDVQTRRLLGLPPVCIPKDDPAVDVKVLVDDKSSVEKRIKKRKYTQKKVKEETKQPPDIKKKFKSENPVSKQINGRKRKAPAMNLLAEKPPNKRERLRENQINRKSKQPMRPELAVDGAVSNVFCAICDKPFYNAGELHRHLDWDHVPRIVTYHCVRCNETIQEKLAIKNHNLWHRLSKTPFECGLCAKPFTTLVGYTRHTQSCLAFEQTCEFKTITCHKCRQEFVTQNLYNWHSCVLAKLKCPICQCTFSKKLATLKHILRCSPSILNTTLSTEIEMPNDEPFDAISDDSMSLHDEINIKPDIDIEIDVPRKKPEVEPSHFVVIPPGVTNSTNVVADENVSKRIHAETSGRNLGTVKSSGSNIALPALINVKKEPGVSIPEVETNINVLNSNPVSDSVVNEPELLASISLRIKAEVINPDYQGLYDPEISANIKQERIEEAQIIGSPKPTLKLVIKKEHGMLNSSFVNNSSRSSDPDVSLQRKKKKKSKKIFKIPKELAMKIKQEKMDGYETLMNSNSNDLNNDKNYDVTMPIISQVCSGSDIDLPSVNVSDGLSLDCRTVSDVENNEGDDSSSKNITSQVRGPIISSVASENVCAQNEQHVIFPAIRIKSEFGLFNFANDDNSLPNVTPTCDRPEYVGNVRIKSEKTDEYQAPVLYSNTALYRTERDCSDLGMDNSKPNAPINTSAGLDSSLNLGELEKSICNENKDNDTADLIISRVESIKTEIESSVTLLNPFATASASLCDQRTLQLYSQSNRNETVVCSQNFDTNEITQHNSVNPSISSNQVVSSDRADAHDKENNVNADQIETELLMSIDQNISDTTEIHPVDSIPVSGDDEECVLVPNSNKGYDKVDDFFDLVSEDDSLSLHDADLEEKIENSTASSKDITKRNETEIDVVENVLVSESDSVSHNFGIEAEVEGSATRLHESEEKHLENDNLTKEMFSWQNCNREPHDHINHEILNPRIEEVSNINKFSNNNEDVSISMPTSEIEKNEALKVIDPEYDTSNENFLELSCDNYEDLDRKSETNIISEDKRTPPIEAREGEENICTNDKSNSFNLENSDKQLENFESIQDRVKASNISSSMNTTIPDSNPPIPVAPNHQQSPLIPETSSSTPSTSYNLNEIAENHNNANIEKQLQNEFDDISSNSNLDFDESTVGSLSEISESSISISGKGKLTSN